MLKFVIVSFILIACCHGVDNELLAEDGRASKKKKTAARLLALVLLFVFSKIAIFKVASFMFSYLMFQKLFYFAGIFLNYFMKQRAEKNTPNATPPAVYGPPASADYNTIGYSYGPPDNSNADISSFPGQEYGLPGLADVPSTSFNNWLFNKKP